MLPVQLLSRIFESLSTKEYNELEDILRIKKAVIPKGSVLTHPLERQRYVFLLLEGKAHAVRYASDGRETDYALLQKGDLLSEAADLLGETEAEYTIFADTVCTVLYFPLEALKSCEHPITQKILWALCEAFSDQCMKLRRRSAYLTCAGLREKIMLYLSDFHTAGEWFEIPLDRNALASYLFCDRTALSRELSRLKKEGYLEFRKNKFRILPAGITKND